MKNNINPYTYYIKRKSDRMQYYGVRYANKVSPEEDLGKKYFSSGKFKKEFKKSNKNVDYSYLGLHNSIYMASDYF